MKLQTRRKIVAAGVGAAFTLPLLVTAAPPAQAASVLVYQQKCYMSTTRGKPTPQVNASVARFFQSTNPKVDRLYIDIQERADIPLQSVLLNGRPAKFRWINHPGGTRANMDTSSPNLVQATMDQIPVTVTWKDNRRFWGGGTLTCNFSVRK